MCRRESWAILADFDFFVRCFGAHRPLAVLESAFDPVELARFGGSQYRDDIESPRPVVNVGVLRDVGAGGADESGPFSRCDRGDGTTVVGSLPTLYLDEHERAGTQGRVQGHNQINLAARAAKIPVQQPQALRG